MTTMPTDSAGEAIQVLQLANDESGAPLAHTIAFTTAAARNTTAFDDSTKVLLLTASEDCHVRLGGGGVVAVTTDHFIKAGIPLPVARGAATYISAVEDSADGSLFVSELK